jgi:hypothetical protein
MKNTGKLLKASFSFFLDFQVKSFIFRSYARIYIEEVANGFTRAKAERILRKLEKSMK